MSKLDTEIYDLEEQIKIIDAKLALYDLQQIRKTIHPSKFKNGLINDGKHISTFISEGLDTNNIFEYYEIQDGLYLIDVGVINNKRHFYITNIDKSTGELAFKYIEMYDEYQEYFMSKNFDLETIASLVQQMSHDKIVETYEELSRVELMDLQLGTGVVFKLFSTVLKIALDYAINYNLGLLFYRADILETSRTKLYDTFYKVLGKHQNITPLASFTLSDLGNMEQDFYDMVEENPHIFNDDYKYYLFSIKGN